ATVMASKDPILAAVRTFDPAARKVRKQWDDGVQGVVGAASEKIARARFALEGRNTYPDATFTLRLSFGTVAGHESTAHGRKVGPFTNFAGAFQHATGQPPFDLPPTWLAAKK